MMLTEIPFFKKLVIMSFSCDECGYKNNEIQSGNALEDYGVKLTFKCLKAEDLQRNVVRGEYAATFLPELELEIPSCKKGYMSTIEGFLTTMVEDLSLD
jgi:zinc finger protein